MGSVAQLWFGAFMETVKTHEAATTLREAAERGELKHWTQALTGIVVGTFPKMGWRGAARGHRTDLLPVPRSEYLALDVVAFEVAGDRRWRFPVGVFELENSPVDDLVAYSLWKVRRVRASLRVVLCYRQDASEGANWCGHLAAEVVQSMEIPYAFRPRRRNSRHRRLAQRNRYFPLRFLQRLDARHQYGALPSPLIGRLSMALKPWYKVVTPREDLREGRPLDASEFAVHLDHVRDGRAPDD